MRVLGLVLALVVYTAGAFGGPVQGARKISGRVVPAEGGTAGAPVPGLTPAPPARGTWARLAAVAGEATNDPVVPIQQDGSFEFQGVAPGAYQIIVLPKISIDAVTVVVGESDVVGIAIGVPRLRVAGSVTVEGDGVQPRFQVSFADSANPLQSAAVAEVGRRFTAALPAGEYRVTISRLPAGYTVKSISAGGIPLDKALFRVSADGAPPIDVTLTTSTPPPWIRIQGRVEGNGTAIRKVVSVTFQGPAMADTISATVNPDGSFEVPRVLPGQYEARTLPAPVVFARTITVGADTANITIAPPNSRDFAGEFVKIPPGEFMMGCSAGDAACLGNEMPAHRVAITKPYEIGKYEVTQAQWEPVMGANPSQFRGADRPVENIIRWEDAQEFIARLNAFNDGHRYRLPTEAEWEYAARAGSTGPFQGAPSPDDVAWYAQNAGSMRQTRPVGQKQPNAWGLHDMLGNVWEWVEDWYDPAYYAASPALDPRGPATGNVHVARGGSVALVAGEVRVSHRGNRPYPGSNAYIYGFRIVREPAP